MTITRTEIEGLASPVDVAALSLCYASISDAACALLGYQRTKQVSRNARLSWEKGNSGPLAQEIKERKTDIITGALLEIYQEYLPLKQALSTSPIKTVCDIGCGQGINDIFLAADFNPSFTLVDIEQTEKQYHLWSNIGSGYANLESARTLLLENGVSTAMVETINPTKDDRDVNKETFDLVTSLYSCGFHYPVDDYIDLFVNTINNGGAICLDLRRRYLRRESDGIKRLLAAAPMHVLYEEKRAVRALFRK